MIDFFVRQSKNGAVAPLRSDGLVDSDRVHGFDLFFLAGKQGKLFYMFFRLICQA